MVLLFCFNWFQRFFGQNQRQKSFEVNLQINSSRVRKNSNPFVAELVACRSRVGVACPVSCRDSRWICRAFCSAAWGSAVATERRNSTRGESKTPQRKPIHPHVRHCLGLLDEFLVRHAGPALRHLKTALRVQGKRVVKSTWSEVAEK